ncbi:Poly [ADP-ribose] polymerase 3 [Sarracenia purpurea var. burkii]
MVGLPNLGDGVDTRHGGLSHRKQGSAVAHSKLDPFVANLMKLLCSQEIYRYSLMGLGFDQPDLPLGMLSDFHLKRCQAAAAFESIRDITVASHLIGDMKEIPLLDDPLFDRYKKQDCTISVLDKKSDDYKMIVDYLERTYEPLKVGSILMTTTLHVRL